MSQEQIIPLVEHHVNKSFSAALEELEKTGAVDKTLKEKTLKQSNIDAMAKQQVKEENPSVGMSDSKIIKLASLAYLIKGFPPEKIKVILSKFDKRESAVLLQYLAMKDLESKLNPDVAAKFLKEVKKTLPVPEMLSYERCFNKLCKIVNNSEKNKISSIIKDERPLIKQFVNSAYSGQTAPVPAMVANVICKYLEEKVS
jgi:response regulator of citrate/malate metabolism